LLGRLVSGNETDAPQITTAEDWHVGFEPGPGDNPHDVPRRKPDYCLNLGINVARTDCAGDQGSHPDAFVQSFGAFVAGAAERAKLVGDTARAPRSTGSAASEPAAITSWLRCTPSSEAMATL